MTRSTCQDHAFWRAELVEQHGSTCSSRRAGHVERVVSRRDVTSNVQFGLVSVIGHCAVSVVQSRSIIHAAITELQLCGRKRSQKNLERRKISLFKSV